MCRGHKQCNCSITLVGWKTITLKYGQCIQRSKDKKLQYFSSKLQSKIPFKLMWPKITYIDIIDLFFQNCMYIVHVI